MAKTHMTKGEAEQILGIAGQYDFSRLRSVRRELVKKFHPDRAIENGMSFKQANETMAKINEAYGVLKKQFDLSGPGTKFTSFYYAPAGNTSSKQEEKKPAEKTVKNKPDIPSPTPNQSTPSKPPEPKVEVDGKEKTKKEKRAEKLQKRQKIADVIELICLFIPFGWIFGILCWTLPFYIFGGLNIFPYWKGLIEPDGLQFLIAYIAVPALGLACFIYSPLINEFLRDLIPQLVLSPIDAIFDVFSRIGNAVSAGAAKAEEEAKRAASEAANKAADMPSRVQNNHSSPNRPSSPSGNMRPGQGSIPRPSPSGSDNRPPQSSQSNVGNRPSRPPQSNGANRPSRPPNTQRPS